MARRGFKAGAVTAPVPPAIVTVGEGDEANAITVAWTGILATVPPKTYISVRPERHSYSLLKRYGEFVINLAPSRLAHAVDYIGMYTGAKVNKFEKCNLTKCESEHIKAPTLAECPIAIECRVCDIIPMGSHDVFIADILGFTCDEGIIDKDGRIDFERADLIAYMHGEYFKIGEKLGKFGFGTKKEKAPEGRAKKPRTKGSASEKPKSEPTKDGKPKPFYKGLPERQLKRNGKPRRK